MTRHPALFLLGGVFSLMIAMGIGRFAYTPILPLMQQSLHFSDAFAGYLASSNYAGYLVGALIISYLPVRQKRTFYLRLSILISIISTILMGFTHHYTFMLMIRFFSGIASAFIFVLASSITLDQLARTNHTSRSGYLYAGVGLGIFFSTLFIPSFNRLFLWEGAWVGLGIISSFLAIFIWFWLIDNPEEVAIKRATDKTILTPPSRWTNKLLLAYGLEGLGYIVTGTFIVLIAENAVTIQMDSTIVWLAVGLGAIPSSLLWGHIAKRFGYVRSLMWAMIFQAISIVVPVFWLTEWGLIISSLLFGATFIGITTVSITLAQLMSPMNSSRIIGNMTAIYAVGQMIGPSIAGVISDYTNSFNVTLIGAAIAVFAGGLILISGIRYEKN